MLGGEYEGKKKGGGESDGTRKGKERRGEERGLGGRKEECNGE